MADLLTGKPKQKLLQWYSLQKCRYWLQNSTPICRCSVLCSEHMALMCFCMCCSLASVWENDYWSHSIRESKKSFS